MNIMGGRMNFKVPFVKEPQGFGWCVAASAAMVLKYYGERISQERIAKEIPVHKTSGADIDKFLIYFLRKNYIVTVKFWLPGLRPGMRGLRGGIENPVVLKELNLGLCNEDDRTQAICWNLKRFVDAGGIVCFEPPFFKDIRRELAARRPIIFAINANWLRKIGSVRDSHLVVVKGLKYFLQVSGKLPQIIFHDPGKNPNMSVNADEFLYACQAGYGFAVFVKPRY